MPFEVFTKRMVPLTKAPFVTIQRRGTFSINKSAWVALGEPEAVEFMYDAEIGVIGLRKVDPAMEHAYAIRPVKTDGPWVASGTAFTKYFNIDTEVSRRYAVTFENDVLCIDLKDGGTVVTSNRSRANGAGDPVEGSDDTAEVETPGVGQLV